MTDGQRRWLVAVTAVAVLLLGGCGVTVERDGPGRSVSPGSIEDAVPRAEPKSKYGNPDSYVVHGKRYYTIKTSHGFAEQGIASWYGKKFHGRKTSSGEIYDMYRMTAAHRQLPLPTYVEVRNLANGRTAVVKVNDRGPFHDNRVIDLSYAAALKLGVVDKGTAFVELRALDAAGQPSGPILAGGAPPVPQPTAAGVYLQVGAFRQRQNAVRLSEQIGSTVSRDVHVTEITSDGTPLYRVQVGPLLSVDLADSIVAMLAQIGITRHHFVTN